MTISQWLQRASTVLAQAGIASSRLDALVLLSDELQHDKAWLLAHDNEQLPSVVARQKLDTQLNRRARREPLGYIRRRREFYGRDFLVTSDVLIPRPETESLIELFNKLPLPPECTVADIGTGSGAIAITLKLQHPHHTIIATDISRPALAIARQNADRLGAAIELRHGYLLEPLNTPVDVIVTNLPYVDKSWERSPETNFEPASALFASHKGLALITELLHTSSPRCKEGGFIIIEADPAQHPPIISTGSELDLRHVTTQGYALLFSK